MEETDESFCTIDYEHHKEIFEKRRQAYLKDPDKAVTTHQAKIRLIRDHYKEAKVPGGYVIGCDDPAEYRTQRSGSRVVANISCRGWAKCTDIFLQRSSLRNLSSGPVPLYRQRGYNRPGHARHARTTRLSREGQERRAVGASLYLAGPAFSGNTINSAEDAIQRVRQQKAEGWDLLKVLPGLTRSIISTVISNIFIGK